MSALILGVPLEDLTLELTYDVIDHLVKDGRASGRTHQIATVNVDFIVNALDDPDLMGILRDSSINFADGMPLVWAAAAARTPLAERVAGSDMMIGIGAESARRGWRVHVFGGAEDVGRRAEAAMLEMNPDATFTVDSGPMLSDVREVPSEVLDDIIARDVDVLCVALGNPKQEFFIHHHAERIGCPVMIGVGGSLDMMVGERKRAPDLAQRAGLEWLARAVQEPARLGPRYVRDGVVFGPKIARELVSGRSSRAGWSLEVVLDSSGLRAAPTRVARCDRAAPNAPSTLDILTAAGSVDIDLDGVDQLSPDGLAVLCQLVRTAERHGQPATVFGQSTALRSSVGRTAVGPWLNEAMNVS